MDGMLTAGMVVSFLCAFFSYIIVSFWIRPIWTYKGLKKTVSHDITAFLDAVNNNTAEDEASQRAIDIGAENLRKHSNALMESFSVSLPVWYKLVLRSRGESIEDAIGHLMGLSNTRNCDHAGKRIAEIRQALKI